MNAYTTSGWENFFVAGAGGAAALTGLVFVSLSINLARILEHPWLPGRAGETILLLLEALLVSALGLVPGQPIGALGVELVALGALGWSIPVLLQLRSRRAHRDQRYLGMRTVITQMATLPVVIAGVSLLRQGGGGMYWLVPGVLLSLVVGVFNAWVLLVEIVR